VQTSGNSISQGVIVLNVDPGGNANISNFSLEQVKIVLAHEMGHLVGLGHSEYETALMYYDIGIKSKLNLGQDDIDGITYLYNRDELSTMKPFGCGSIDAEAPPGGPFALLLLLPLLVLTGLSFSSKVRLKSAKV
jgi:hypothetical protein